MPAHSPRRTALSVCAGSPVPGGDFSCTVRDGGGRIHAVRLRGVLRLAADPGALSRQFSTDQPDRIGGNHRCGTAGGVCLCQGEIPWQRRDFLSVHHHDAPALSGDHAPAVYHLQKPYPVRHARCSHPAGYLLAFRRVSVDPGDEVRPRGNSGGRTAGYRVYAGDSRENHPPHHPAGDSVRLGAVLHGVLEHGGGAADPAGNPGEISPCHHAGRDQSRRCAGLRGMRGILCVSAAAVRSVCGGSDGRIGGISAEMKKILLWCAVVLYLGGVVFCHYGGRYLRDLTSTEVVTAELELVKREDGRYYVIPAEAVQWEDGRAFIWVAEVTEEYPEARFMARRMEIIPETADGQLLIHNIEIQNKKVIIQTKTELVEGEMIICNLS